MAHWRGSFASVEKSPRVCLPTAEQRASVSVVQSFVFEEVLNLFGEDGPFTDRRKRSQQLAGIYSKHETEFDKLDGRYYKLNETIEVFMLRYVIQNADQFK